MFAELSEEVKQKTGKDLSIFDLICHVAFDMPPLSRKERAENVKKRNYFGGTPYEIIKEFGGKDKYEEAIRELERELFSDEVA